MEWRDIAQTVGKIAPIAGGALAGKAGSAVGSIIAGVLGVEERPEAVEAAIQADPQAVERLRRLEQEHEREMLKLSLESETARLSEINQTMRAEVGSESTFRAGWRPFNGWMLALSLASVNFGLIGVIIKDPTQLSVVVDVLIWSVAAQAAVQGVNIKQRSNDKARQMGQTPSGFMDAISAIRKR
ncbi:3TM-type holin [Halomonas sp. DWK9]|uniref:3TM-type holin n=1 Tax=Halomonas sp. DWK9 TaxID=3060155 RepID=UPI00287FF205|nr:3TM-type holin [Halomonas sp. DWK9]